MQLYIMQLMLSNMWAASYMWLLSPEHVSMALGMESLILFNLN